MGDALPPYSSIRPEERLVRISAALHTELYVAFDRLEEQILLRSLDPEIRGTAREPSKAETDALTLYEQVLKLVYFDKERAVTELDLPLHRGLRLAIHRLLDGSPPYVTE